MCECVRVLGTWSKQWEIRSDQQCQLCPTGVVCPIEGMTNPCSTTDFPTLFSPIPAQLAQTVTTQQTCLNLNSIDFQTDPRFQTYFWGQLDPSRPWAISVATGEGPYFVQLDALNPNASCYVNDQALGSPVYQRFKAYYGPL